MACYVIVNSPLPGASMRILPLSQPCPTSINCLNYDICGRSLISPRKEADVRITSKIMINSLSAIIEILSCGLHVMYNNLV